MSALLNRSSALVAAAACIFAFGCAGHAPATFPTGPTFSASVLPRTRPERTEFKETSHYSDVMAFLDSLRTLGFPLHFGSIGSSPSGKSIPYVIALRPLVRSAAEARRLGRPIVYVQGNIHAGEVEGKEALLAMLRDLTIEQRPNVLDSIVLVAIPIYNIDGNDQFGPQARQRSEQNGPEDIGRRANGQGLDLNRDYVKADAPETRGSLAMFNEWNPDVFVDLHTTDGSFHGYALTYAPSLAPSAIFGGVYARDSMLPELRSRMRTKRKFETFDYGNFPNEGPEPNAWESYDPRPRFGTNYYGIRGGIAILSEAFSHDPLDRRIASTDAFVREILSMVAEKSASIRALRRRAAEWTTSAAGKGATIALRSDLTKSPYQGDVLVEDLVKLGDSTLLTQPGVPRGWKRSGTIRTVRMPVYDRFDATMTVPIPKAYAVAVTDTAAIRLLALHGIHTTPVTSDMSVSAAAFSIDSMSRAKNPFQNHNTVSLEGRWGEPAQRSLPGGRYIMVRTDQPLGVLAAFLLEPQSEDGFVTWNVFDSSLERGGTFPVLRIF